METKDDHFRSQYPYHFNRILTGNENERMEDQRRENNWRENY